MQHCQTRQVPEASAHLDERAALRDHDVGMANDALVAHAEPVAVRQSIFLTRISGSVSRECIADITFERCSLLIVSIAHKCMAAAR